MAIIEDFDKKIGELKRLYRKVNRPIVFNFRDFCSVWKWAKRSDVFTHHMHKYPAKLIPYIPIFFLSSKICSENDIVMDPFAGSGTVLLESIAHPYYKRNCVGIEINPLARLIAKVKTTPLDSKKLQDKKIKLFLNLKRNDINPIIPEYDNLNLWFSKNAQNKLGKLRACIEELENDDYKDFFFACFSSVIRKVSLADPNIPPPVVLKRDKYKKASSRHYEMKDFLERNKTPKVKALFKQCVDDNERRVKSLSDIEDIYKGKVKARIIWDDSRNPKVGRLTTKGNIEKKGARAFKENSIGLIITSPPYITAQKYIRTTKLELLWLGLADSKSLNELDKATIGSERVKVGEKLVTTNIKSIDDLCNKIAGISEERAIMVNRYFNDMLLVIRNSYKMLKKDREMILIVGNNKACGYDVNTHDMLAEIGESVGFRREMVIKDRIRSRGMITRRHKNGGLIEDEYIVVLRK